MAPSTEIAKRIKLIREALELRQNKMAEGLGISNPTMSDLERGKYDPNVKILTQLVRQYNVNLNYIILGEGEMFSTRAESKLGEIFSSNQIVTEEEFLRFLNDLKRSPFLLLAVFSNYRMLKTRDSEVIEKEFENYEKLGNS